MDDDNSILGRMPAEFISRALDMMGDAYAGNPGDVATAAVKVLELGDVSVTAVLKVNPRWRSYSYWAAVRADRLGDKQE